jgi:phage-related protein
VKPIRWMRNSRECLKAFPEDARGVPGHSLHLVQRGERPRNEKPLHGDLSGVSELVADSRDGRTYRSVYTVKLDPFVYVLHCFEKKAKSGIATPKLQLDVIRRRLKEAKEEYREYQRNEKAKNS